MLLRDINTSEGMSNGTRLQIVHLTKHCIQAKIISEKYRGALFYLFRMDLTSDESSLTCKMLHHQFPILPAYAMTITKSQGQTIEKAGVYLNTSVFAHGQLYVALSRCRAQDNIKFFERFSNTENSISKFIWPELKCLASKASTLKARLPPSTR